MNEKVKVSNMTTINNQDISEWEKGAWENIKEMLKDSVDRKIKKEE